MLIAMTSTANSTRATDSTRAIESTKKALRADLRARRNALDAAAQAEAATALAERLRELREYRSCRAIALYFANDGEIDPQCAAQWWGAQGARVFAPVIVRGAPNFLRFAEITETCEFTRNDFGIAEPRATELVEARELDLALLPLVGFDRSGNRLGMGGGFYDATFAYKKTEPHSAPPLIGLAHEIQCVDELRAERWDIPIDAVVTDRRVYRCARH